MQELLKTKPKSGTEVLDKVKFWAEMAQAELSCFVDITSAIDKVLMLADAGLLWIIEVGDKGVISFIITEDFRGQLMGSEVFFYVRPEHRGSIKTFKKLIDVMENTAKEDGCKYVTFGSNIGYRDDKLLSLLSRFDYTIDTVKKEI